MQFRDRTIAYLAFGGFCCLTSSRDVLSEFLFKDQLYDVSPIFALFVYSAITQVVAAIVFFAAPTSGRIAPALFERGVLKAVVLLNIFTLAAFLLYFIAIASPAGAAVNSFVDYGSGPVFTALVGTVLLGERLDRIFALSAAAASLGIIVLALPRVDGNNLSSGWLLGVLIALLSSLAGAFYRVYFKVLLQKGLSKALIVFLRLIGITLVLGGVLLARPELFRSDILVRTALIGILGLAIPLFLVLGAIQRLAIRSYAMLLFLLPVLTYLMSAALGYGRLYISDLLAGGLLLAGIAIHELHAKQSNSTA